MRAMVFTEVKKPLERREIPKPQPGPGEVLIEVSTCGVCRTDLHIVDGELPSPKLPLVLGHQIVGRVEALGAQVNNVKIGDRVGIPWLGGGCGRCSYCLSGSENLCDRALYTGYQIDGGFAEYCIANASFTFPLPSRYTDLQAAPLLCAGLIGYRALRLAGEAKRIGFYGFGSSAHILIQIVRHRGGEVYIFTRKPEGEKKIGSVWAGTSDEAPPVPLDAAIIFAPVGELIPLALKAVKKGGVVVCAGIHMSDIPSFPYSLLWNERVLRSVANLTRRDGKEFLELAPRIPIITEVIPYPLEELNQALNYIREGSSSGSAVIVVK